MLEYYLTSAAKATGIDATDCTTHTIRFAALSNPGLVVRAHTIDSAARRLE